MILITQPRVGRSHNEIIALQMAGDALGWEVLPAPYSWRMENELIQSGKDGVPYGSFLFCEAIAQQMGWQINRNTFDWLAKLPIEYTKRKVDFMTLGEAKQLTERKFIKPADDKCFDALVYDPGTFNPPAVIDDSYPTLVSEVVDFTVEYRCFVDHGKVRTWSNYMFHGLVADPRHWESIPDGVEGTPYEFLEDMLSKISVPTVASVIDVGYLPDRGWAIIETNEAHASGLYGCDPVEALKVMSQTCVPIKKEK